MSDIHSIAVFCGSKVGADPAFRECAQCFGRLLAERGVRLVYGGGGIGLMGVLADAVLGGGGHVTGVIPEFLVRYEVGKPGLSETIVVPSMHDRKRRMFEMADGFVVLPGGLGTLDEAIEILTWKQLQLHAKPVVFLDVDGFWGRFSDLVAHIVAQNFAHKAISDLFSVVDDPTAVFQALENAPPPNREVLTSHF